VIPESARFDIIKYHNKEKKWMAEAVTNICEVLLNNEIRHIHDTPVQKEDSLLIETLVLNNFRMSIMGFIKMLVDGSYLEE
jgi:hypothetical protein